MTSRTACHYFLAANLVFFFQIHPFCCIKIAVLPLHVIDLGLRPNKSFRFAMALQTPLHLQGVLLVDGRHLVDLAVASRTTDSLCYVNAVIEICEFRKVVDTLPLDRRIVTKACTYRFEIVAVRPYLAVAVHTR